MMKLAYYFLWSIGYLCSLIPLRGLYWMADCLFFPLTYHLIRYRRKIVMKNLSLAFPEKAPNELHDIARQFFHFFCDYIVETLKLLSISKAEMQRRMTFSGVDEIVKTMNEEDKLFCFVYLGHYGNWEWIASLPYWVPDDVLCAQIYHPLKNKSFDRLFLEMRNHFGGKCLPMKETLRDIIKLRKAKQKTIIGFISDQAPKMENIHHWTEFLHQDTPVFIGTEKIGKQVDALIWYAHVTRPKRGYYHCEFRPISNRPKEAGDYELTDLFTLELQRMIQDVPYLWLWSHNRWKRDKGEWLKWKQHQEEIRKQ